MATKQELSEKWSSILESVKQKYGQITDGDLERVEGDVQKLASVIQQKTGQSKEQIEAFLGECCGTTNSLMGQVADYASDAGQSIREGYDLAADQARHGYQATVKSLSRHPLESAGIAMGVGLLLGIVVGISIGGQRERDLSWRERWSR